MITPFVEFFWENDEIKQQLKFLLTISVHVFYLSRLSTYCPFYTCPYVSIQSNKRLFGCKSGLSFFKNLTTKQTKLV